QARQVVVGDFAVECDFGPGQEADGHVGRAYFSKATGNRPDEVGRHKLVADLRVAGRHVMEAIVTHAWVLLFGISDATPTPAKLASSGSAATLPVHETEAGVRQDLRPPDKSVLTDVHALRWRFSPSSPHSLHRGTQSLCALLQSAAFLRAQFRFEH